MSNDRKPHDKDNILHCLFSLEKTVNMPQSCCVKNCINSTKNNENVKFYLLPNDKVRRKLRLNAIGRVYVEKDENIDNKGIWSPKSPNVCSEHFITVKFILIDICMLVSHLLIYFINMMGINRIFLSRKLFSLLAS